MADFNYKFGLGIPNLNLKVKAELIRRQNDRIEESKKKNKIKRITKVPNYESKSEIFLANLKKHLVSLKRKQETQKRKKARRFVQDMKKESYRYEDMQKPNYKVYNKYRYSYFANQVLTRSMSGLTVAKAWHLLSKCWIGFKKSHRLNNIEGMRFYGKGIQKYLWLLEEIPLEFSDIGLKPYKAFTRN